MDVDTPGDDNGDRGLSRRDSLKIGAAITSLAGIAAPLRGANAMPARGYGTDPRLLEPEVTWPRTLSQNQLATLAAICAVVLPATDDMPDGNTLRVPAFVDEWVSAPYPQQRASREIVLNAMTALDAVARSGGHRDFAGTATEKRADVFKAAWTDEGWTSSLMRKLVHLLVVGYATTDQGMAVIGFRGNKPLARFDGPPPEVTAKLDEFVSRLATS